MSSAGKNKKKKWKSIAVEEILPHAVVRPATSWAEEVESELSEYTIKKITSISLPTAPRAATDLVIDESKINPNGPFMAYLSNLPYEITEDDIAAQFKELKVVNIQLPKDSRHDRMKGFGYVEFKDKSSLLTALNEGELTLKGRLVRISLPNEDDQNKDKGSRSGGVSFSRRDVSDRIDSSDKNLGEWRAAAPIPHDPDKGGFTRPGQREGPSERDRDRDRPFREPRAFDSEPSGSFSRGGFRGGERDRDRDRDRDFEGRSNDRGGSNRLFGKRYDREERGGGRMSFGRRFERSDDREFTRREPPPPVEKEEPKSRPKLDIQPRTKPLEPNVPEALPSSIFGGAKPVDTLKREMEIEAKLSAAATQVTERSRGSTPPPVSTPMSSRSRSPSVSSVSSSRRHDDNADTAYESHQTGQSDNESRKGDNCNVKHEFKEPQPPKNVWLERKAAAEAAAAETNVESSSSVIEKSNVYDNANESNVIEENRSQNENASRQQPSSGAAAESRLSSTSDDDFIRYEPDHFSGSRSDHYANSDTAQQSNRGSGRYNDSKFNFNRDNRSNRDNRRETRGRKPDNGGQFRRSDDNHYGSGGRSSDNSKWNYSGGRGRNGGPGGPRRAERDNGFYRERNNDSGTNFSRSSFSSSTSNLRDDDRYDRKHDERLSDDVRGNRDEDRVRDTALAAAADERLKILSDDNANKKTLENGNENGVEDDSTRKSNESIANVDDENDSAFSCSKNRKKDKKKKRDGDDSDANEKSEKPRNQKDEKKIVDNHQVNDKANNKNIVKNKDKNTKKNREVREEGSQLPKAKEEKAPNFQDSNRFLFLESDD